MLRNSASRRRAPPVRSGGWAALMAAASCCPASRTPLRAGRGTQKLGSHLREGCATKRSRLPQHARQAQPSRGPRRAPEPRQASPKGLKIGLFLIRDAFTQNTPIRGQAGARCDVGSWQIVDRYTMASSAARCVAVHDFRVRFAGEPQLPAGPELCASREGRRHGVQNRGARARPAALLPQSIRSIC